MASPVHFLKYLEQGSLSCPVHFLKYLEQGSLSCPVHVFKYLEQGSLSCPVHFFKYLEQGLLWLVLCTSLTPSLPEYMQCFAFLSAGTNFRLFG